MEVQTSSLVTARTAIPQLLVVEDDRIVALDLAGTLQELGYSVIGSATRGEDAVELVHRLRPDLVLMDVRLAGKLDGIQAAHLIRSSVDVPVIYLTAHSDRETLQRAAETIASGYLVKPFKATELRCTIEIALHKHATEVRMREREQWISTALHSIADAVIATDQSGCIKLFNRIAEQFTGWQTEDAQGRRVEDVLDLRDQAGQAPRMSFRDVLESRIPTITIKEAHIRGKDGQRFVVEEAAAPILDAYSNLLGCVLVLRDITEREQQVSKIRELNEQLEQRVHARTAELENANRELEAFSYSVAHDLRAPLRGIDSFSALLMTQCGETLDAIGVGYVERVRRCATRMSELIDALLSLSRVSQCDIQTLTLDLSQLVEALAAESQGPRDASIQVEPGLRARGDPRLLRLAIGNLLSNARKFTSRRADPKISVGQLAGADTPTFFVRDNGAGFDPQHAEKLFAPFQRLHSEAEFPGMGIGLAIVQRVITRHGGTLRAESQLGAGATFYFSLPWSSP